MCRKIAIFAAVLTLFVHAAALSAASPQIILVQRPPDPHGTPRPAPKARDVPLGTSIYFELSMPDVKDDQILAESVAARLQPQRGEATEVLQPGRRFADGGSGWLRPTQIERGGGLAVYLEPPKPLTPSTAYTVVVRARSRRGAELPEAAGTWTFTTEADPGVRAFSARLDLSAEPVRWHGAFFSGICNVVFCTRAATFKPTYDLMDEARKEHPKAWSYQRDFWMTGTEDRKPSFFAPNLPNIVRQRETRRITAMEQRQEGVLLRVEDFFGHQQYGIPAGRSIAADYHPGDQVLIADGLHDARAKVVSADDRAGTVLVGPVAVPPGGWQVAYEGALPEREDPEAPGLFPPGGCYLRKVQPPGTPCYFWGRLDKEWDLVHRRYRRRLLVNFADAPGDLSLDGRSWTTVSDYAQWHAVARVIAGHLIDRYGADALTFSWSIFNEPDLGPMFWRTDWNELQRYYDYTTDAILRAFEDRGYDSDRVFIGGLELGGIFGPHLKLTEFLAHCSPRATAKGALPVNAAVADPRLAGKRSRRVERLCGPHGGKGTPCDFISIHSYNRSELMAAKLIRAKEMALEIDPEYYRGLWVNSHESCPDWRPPPDEAAADSYLGNGYFSSWCADVVDRQLRQAVKDPRYAFGETLLTVWPPPQNFAGMNAVTRMLQCDDNGDGRADRTVTIPTPVFHVLGLLSDMGDRYWVLPQQHSAGHVVAGFASRDQRGVVRILIYAHHAGDTQSRSRATFDIALDLAGLGWNGAARVRQYRFDRDHNSYFRQARALREDRRVNKRGTVPIRAPRFAWSRRKWDCPLQRSDSNCFAGPKLAEGAKDEVVRETARTLLGSALTSGKAYSGDEVERIRELAQCRVTSSASLSPESGGRLRLTARVAGNGLNILVIQPDVLGPARDKPDTRDSVQPKGQ